MANRLYDPGREGFLAGEIDWDANTIKAVLVDLADYTPNFVTDKFLADIPVAARVATCPNGFGTKTVTAGVADAADLTGADAFQAVTGDQCEALVIFADTGSAATSRLIGYIDTATNLPVTPNGTNINVTWDNGANKIFKL